MDQLWQIDLLGGLRARREYQTITRFRTQKAGLLLAYLALQPRRAHPRVALAEMLWPGSEPLAGRLNLRVELTSLRRQLEPPGVPPGSVLMATYTAVQLNPRAIGTDVAAFEATLQQAAGTGDRPRRIEALRRAVGHYGGELLPGCFEEWALPERRRLADLYLAALRELSSLLLQAGDADGAVEAAHQAVAADPLSEEARFDLIRLYACTDRPAEALCQYHELEKSWREELGQEPSTTIRQFALRLAAPVSSPPAKGGRPAVPCAGSHAPPRPAGPAVTGSLPPARPSLPLTLTRLFGREAELQRLCAMLAPPPGDHETETGRQAKETGRERAPGSPVPRLITLTGPGGSGKTRLAIEAARRLSVDYRDAVSFVPLADRSDPDQIPAALAEALQLPRSPEVDPLEQAAGVLARSPSLLVLDNMEHLLDGGREIVWQLLERAPALVCLVTSRQRLDLDGEREILVAPLPVPGEGVGCRGKGVGSGKEASLDPYTPHPTPYPLAQCPSVALYVDRAQAARPDFQVTPRNAAAVAALCAYLEGLPLAIELAAAWARALTPEQMVAQLEGGSSLLVSRRRDAAPRHRSLHAAIEWSYRLLDPDLQRLFKQLAVFRGRWDLAAAQAVCGGDRDVLPLLAALEDRSLVVGEVAGETMRYHLLETVREYAGEQLTGEEWSNLVRRHTAYYLSLAEQAEPHLRGARQREWAARLQVDEPNLQAALERSEGSEEGLRLAAALPDFWQWRGQLSAGRRWLERQLSACPDASPAARAKATFAAAALAYLSGDPAGGERLCEEGLRHCRLLSSPAAVAAALQPLTTPHLHLSSPRETPRLLEALIQGGEDPRVQALLLAAEGGRAQVQGEYATAAAVGAQSLAIYQELGDRRGLGTVLGLRGSVAFCQGDLTTARRNWEEGLARYRELDDQTGICRMTGALGYVALHQGDRERGERLTTEALALSRRIGNRESVAAGLCLLGNLAFCQRQYDQALALLEESLEIRRALGAPGPIADTLVVLGLMGQARGDYPHARAVLEEAIMLRRQRTDKLDLAEALFLLGSTTLDERRSPADAGPLLEESLTLSRQMRNDILVAHSLRGLGSVAVHQGDFETAEERLLEGLAEYRRLDNRKAMAEGLEALAELRLRQERHEEAAALYGAADAIREAINSPVPPGTSRVHTRALASLRAALGPERFSALWNQARERDSEDVLVEVLGPTP